MKEFQIHLGDWTRTFIGNVPPSFFIEVIIRITVVYLILLGSMRLLGRRMAAQLSRIELIGMVALAAAIGVPVIAADRGLLPAIIIAVIVVFIGRQISLLSMHSQRFEKISQGNVDILVKDGALQINILSKTGLSRERVVSMLRSRSIKNLGQIKRLYFEANGNMTIVKDESKKEGLSLIPDWHRKFIDRQEFTDNKVCKNCGMPQVQGSICDNCGQADWTQAMKEADS